MGVPHLEASQQRGAHSKVHAWMQVSSAAPVAAALASGSASDATLSRLYGGSAAEGVSELSMAVPVYEAIGKVSSYDPVLYQPWRHTMSTIIIVCTKHGH